MFRVARGQIPLVDARVPLPHNPVQHSGEDVKAFLLSIGGGCQLGQTYGPDARAFNVLHKHQADGPLSFLPRVGDRQGEGSRAKVLGGKQSGASASLGSLDEVLGRSSFTRIVDIGLPGDREGFMYSLWVRKGIVERTEYFNDGLVWCWRTTLARTHMRSNRANQQLRAPAVFYSQSTEDGKLGGRSWGGTATQVDSQGEDIP